VLYKLMLFKS